MSKNQKRTIGVVIIVLIAFSVVAFALPFKMTGLFWVSYIFAVISILSQLYVLKIAFEGAETAKSQFYGFPIAQVGIVYMLIQLALSLIFMALSMFVPVWVALVLYVLLLSAAAIGCISTDAMRDEITRQDVKLETDVSCMTTLRSLVYPLAEQCSDETAKKILRDLADEFRYSDPVSRDAIRDIENELELLVADLQKAVSYDNVADINAVSAKINTTLTERNRLCKLNKRK